MWRKWWGRRPGATANDPPGGPGPPPPPSGPRERTPEDEELLDRIAAAVARWGMTVPAVFLLESSKPLNFVGSQFLHFLSPIVHTVLDVKELDRLAVMLERRDTLEELIRRIESAETSGARAAPPKHGTGRGPGSGEDPPSPR